MIVVGTIGNTRYSMACFSVVFGDVVVEVTLFSNSFVLV